MSVDVNQDVRYSVLSEAGKEELKVYLDWLNEHQLADSEYSFVYFAIGRAGLQDGRHLFAVWQKVCEGMTVDISTRQHTMRFFLNPTQASFTFESAAGWFDFLPQVYELSAAVAPADAPSPPPFIKMGDVAAQALILAKPTKFKSAQATDQHKVVLHGWGVGVMHYTINRDQLAQVMTAYAQGSETGALTYLFSQCPTDRPIRYFMGADEGLTINRRKLNTFATQQAAIDLGFEAVIDNSATNILGAEFYCLLYSPDMRGEIVLREGQIYDPDKLQLSVCPYQMTEENYCLALEGELIAAASYDQTPVAIQCTPADYSYYGQLLAYYAKGDLRANLVVFQSNIESGQWELSGDILSDFLSNKLTLNI